MHVGYFDLLAPNAEFMRAQVRKVAVLVLPVPLSCSIFRRDLSCRRFETRLQLHAQINIGTSRNQERGMRIAYRTASLKYKTIIRSSRQGGSANPYHYVST